MNKKVSYSYSRIPINKRKNDNGHRKSPFEKHHSNNYRMQESSMGDKIGR